MTSRPRPLSTSSKFTRPLSAIYLGSGSGGGNSVNSPGQPPDLPELPTSSSPGSSSGLPSPPASSCTDGSGDLEYEIEGDIGSESGSGSLGSSVKTVRQSIRHDAMRSNNNNINGSSGSFDRPSSRSHLRPHSPHDRGASRSPIRMNDGHEIYDENDKITAELQRLQSESGSCANGAVHARSKDRHNLSAAADEDNTQSTLQRFKSLAERNRMVLDKLTSISAGSRLSSPSPTGSKRSLPIPPARSVDPSYFAPIDNDRRREESLSRASGSETEREREHVQHDLVSSSDAETPTSISVSSLRPATTIQERRVSSFAASSSTSNSRDRSYAPIRERASTQRESHSSGKGTSRIDSRSGDITAAALAAVANSRHMSPTDRRRQPLPCEFRANRSSFDGDSQSRPQQPSTPRRSYDQPTGMDSNLDTPSARTVTPYDFPQPLRTRPQRFSTLREAASKPPARWTHDITPPRAVYDEEGRPVNRRAGSGNIPTVPGGRSVVSETLKAAGLARRRDDSGDDVFGSGDPSTRLVRRSHELTRPIDLRVEVIKSNSRHTERSLEHSYADPRTPANQGVDLPPQRNAYSSHADRPISSLARYREEPRTAPPVLRNLKTASAVEMERLSSSESSQLGARPTSRTRNVFSLSSAAAAERAASVIGRHVVTSPLNLSSVSVATDTSPEHTRLMLESLTMFESQLARLPSMGSTTTTTIPELFRNAQNIVHSANVLNTMLRNGTAHALEEQIDAEIGEDANAVDLVELWRSVGAEYRESVRVCDDLVRTMTAFLLGVGKVLRESTAERLHNGAGSLEETSSRHGIHTPELSRGGPRPGRTSEERRSSDGHSSIDGKRRWEISSGEMAKTTTSFTSLTSSSVSRLSLASKAHAAITAVESEGTAASSGGSLSAASRTSDLLTRRLSRLSLLAGRRSDSRQEAREPQPQPLETSPAGNDKSFSEDSGPDDSPLAAVSAARERQKSTLGLMRRTHSVAIPTPLPTLPSESLIEKDNNKVSTTVKTVTITRPLPKQVAASDSPTITSANRASAILPQATKTGEPTTAVSIMQVSPERPTVSISTAAAAMTSSRLRTGSVSKTLPRTSTGVLQVQMARDRDGRQRTASVSSVVSQAAEQDKNRSPKARAGVSDSEVAPVMTISAATRARAILSGGIMSGTFSSRAKDRRTTVNSLLSRT